MSFPTSGNLAEHPLGPLVYSLATSSFDGALALDQDGRRYALWYKGGLIVDAESASPDDQLGRVLLQAGVIDGAQLGDSIRRLAMSPSRRQLDILVEMGALQGEMIERAALMGLVRRALRLFHHPDASYAIEARDHDRRGGGPVDCRWILYKGVRQYYDEKRLERELAALGGRAVKLAAAVEPHLDAFGFADEERIVLGYLGKGYWELVDLIEACVSLARPLVLSVAYSLWSSGCLDAQPAESVPRLRKRAREMTEVVSRQNVPPSRSSYVQTAGVRKEDLFEGSEPSVRTSPAKRPTRDPAAAPARAIPAAPAAPPKRPTVPAPGGPPAPPGTATSRSTAEPQRLTVQAPGMREQIAKKYAALESGVDHFAVLEVTRDAGRDQVKTSYFTLAKLYHPDRLALVQLEELRPQVDRIFARLSEAFSVLGDDGKRREYLDILARGGEAAVKRREDDEASQAARIIGAEEQFRLGEMALRRQLIPQALEYFKKAMEMNPEEAEHHALYYWALWCSTPNKEAVAAEVKRGLQRALDLNHRCVPALYYFGQVYNQIGDTERAFHQFQKVLSYRPGHVDAEREVRLIEMRRKKGPEKKTGSGLFDKFKKR